MLFQKNRTGFKFVFSDRKHATLKIAGIRRQLRFDPPNITAFWDTLVLMSVESRHFGRIDPPILEKK